MSTHDPFVFNSGSGTHQNHVEPLPAETRSNLRSTQILTCLAQIVSELLQNSLDAGARHVEISVDCEEWSCWVRDDGKGISKNGMNMLAKEEDGGRYGEG
jgi:DNA mismatch repair protein MLH3